MESRMKYSPDWDLSTIPDMALNSELGRRRVSKRSAPGNIKLEPCSKCGREMTARRRRLPCPAHLMPSERGGHAQAVVLI